MMNYSHHEWFKPRGYTHFTGKLETSDIGFVSSYVSDPRNVIKHKFHPLIHRTIVAKRLKKISGQENKKHWEIDPASGKRKTTANLGRYFMLHTLMLMCTPIMLTRLFRHYMKRNFYQFLIYPIAYVLIE